MDKAVIIGIGVVVVVGLAVFFTLGRGTSEPSAQARFQARLEAARAGSSGEQIAEGTVRATGGTTKTPRGSSGVVAWTHWRQERISAGSDFYRAKDLQFGSVPFTVETEEGPLLVEGELRGLSDIVQRNRAPTGEVEVTLAEGDHVTLLGPISEREGTRGLFGEVIVVKGTYQQWHTALNKTFFGSLPEAPK